MRKSFFRSMLCLILPCTLAITVVLVYFLRFRASSNELVDYFTVAIVVCLAVTIVFIVTANIFAQKLTEKIVKSLDSIGVDNDYTSLYDELMPYAGRMVHQKQDFETRLARLADRADTIEAITSNMKEGLILTDRNGIVLMANNSAHEAFGENMERKNVMHICRDEEFQAAVKKCIAGENAEMQMERGTKVYVVFLSPVFSNKAIRGAVILFHDVTERHRAEKQRREFSANVSHELKTPLTTISALSEMIEQGIAKEVDIKSFAGRISEQSGRLLVLIDDIIRLSEFDEGRLAKENTVFNLWELAENVINALRDNAGNVELQLTGERFDISANHRMIDELLYNLIDNGVKYNTESGKVTVALTRIDNGVCRISVADTGIGIPKQHHPHVFERFYRVDRSRSKKTGGTGLGLSIVKHITEYYNGSLELESAEGTGTTVTCNLKG
jgi:two-component system phosphate regulon sensor histidine kinase PhoR